MSGKRILITGAGGRLGAQLVRMLSHTGQIVLPFDRESLDIADWTAVRQALGAAHPDPGANDRRVDALGAQPPRV